MSLLSILQDGVTEIEFVAEITYRDPVTDVVTTDYLSLHGTVPDTGPSDTPPNQSFPRRLNSIGPFRESLEADLLFSGRATHEVGDVVVDNTEDAYSSWLQYTFAGRSVVIRGGAQGAAYSTFEIVAMGTARGEPVFSGNDITISLQSVLSRLDKAIKVNRYVGIPTCFKGLTATGAVTRAHNAVYNLTSFTLMGRFRLPVAGLGAIATLMRKEISATDRNWRILLGTNHRIEARISVGGVNVLIGNPTQTFNNGQWTTWVVAVQGGVTSYIMMNNEVLITTALTGNPNVQTATLATIVTGLEVCDHRIYNSYLSPDEARAVSAARSEGDETSTVALWRFDDGGGATITDYSPTALNATAGGVENTDFTYQPTDLGMPELAGSVMPIVYGDVFNAPVDLIDDVNERHRWHDGLSNNLVVYNPDVTFKSRGDVLAEGVDWDHDPDIASGVIETTGEVDQPTTFDTSLDTPGSYPNAILEFIMIDRGEFNNAADIRLDWLDAMSYLLPSPSGVIVNGDGIVNTPISEYLSGIAGHVRWDRVTGKFLFSHLLPPICPAPYEDGNGVSALEFVGSPDDEIDFGNIANPTSSMSVACWFKTSKSFQDATGGFYSISPLVYKDSGVAGYRLMIESNGALEFVVRGVGQTITSPLFIKLDTWYFAMGSFDDTANTQSLYVGEMGSSLASVKVDSSRTGTPITNSISLLAGNSGSNTPLLGSIAHVQVWSKAHTLSQAQALMTTPPVGNEANLLFYSPINDGVGSTTVAQLVGPTTGTISGLLRWSPQLTVNLESAEPNGSISSINRVIPAADIDIKYKVNHNPMTQADIAAGVSDADALALKKPHESYHPTRADISEDFEQTRTISITSPFLNRGTAAYLWNLLATRFGPDRYMAEVAGIHRNALLLNLTDEVRLVSDQYGLSDGVYFRVTGKVSNPSELSTALTLALGKLD